MADLKTRFMGLELANPVIAGSSGLTGSVDGVKRCVDAGAGAVVLKSMFEELIVARNENLERDMIQSEHPEAYEYIRAELGMQLGPRPHLRFIEDVRKSVAVPVIASVNCISSKWWVSYAKNIESAGADAIELNISHFPGAEESSDDVERRYADIVADVAGNVSIPIAAKVGHYFTSVSNLLEAVVAGGAKGLVLFNRLYSVDIDIDKKAVVPSMKLSSPEEMLVPLRWVGLMSGKLHADIAASTGIHDSESIVKMLMAGARATQICSVLYRKGPSYVADLVKGLNDWLDANNYASVNDIRGVALGTDVEGDVMFRRIQYVKALEEAAKYEY